jgi:fatty-acyl-CoA synthase
MAEFGPQANETPPADAPGDLMQSWSLTLDKLIEHAARWNGAREIVSRLADGTLHRTTWSGVHTRARRLSGALLEEGICPGDRVATLAMNGHRHLEAWYAIMGIGAVCHTLNPRLFADDLVYMVNHAADRWILADPMFAPILAPILARCPSIERVVLLGDRSSVPSGLPVRAEAYEVLLEGRSDRCRWGEFDERTPAGLCYTSGTTGHPKGVLYSHRSNFLHTLAALQGDCLGFRQRDVVMPVVPMFHANGWGLPFAAAAVGAKLVLPGARLDGASLYELLESERVTFAAAVPSVWQVLLDYLDANALNLTSLRRVMIGGSACPEVLIRSFHARFGIDVKHGWGMTEMSPIGTFTMLTEQSAQLDTEAQLALAKKQGRALFGVDMKITDEEGTRLPHDGVTPGHLKVRGPAVVARYFGDSDREVLDAEGYFDTGDVATIDADGYMTITDRAKDLIKSGGEWISSVEIENLATGHPKALMAAVIAIPHPKWGERPLLLVRLKPGLSATREEFAEHLAPRLARWWMPDDILFVDEIPLGATGKIDKKKLRAAYIGYRCGRESSR